jgi:hypothetical protein
MKLFRANRGSGQINIWLGPYGLHIFRSQPHFEWDHCADWRDPICNFRAI